MAHQSGWAGVMTVNNGPTKLVIAPNLQSWRINQTRGRFTCFGKSEAWQTSFVTSRGWTGEVTALLPDDATVTDIGINGLSDTVEHAFVFKANASDTLTGNAWITDNVQEDPLDGPVLARLSLLGNGALTPAVA